MILPFREILDGIRWSRKQAKDRARLKARFPTLRLEPNVLVKGDLNNLLLAGDVVVQSGSVLHLGGMPWCQSAGRIEIGAGSCISPNCVLYGCGPGGIGIGRAFDCGPGVGIFASRTDYEKGPDHHVFEPVEIGDEVIVFANAVISPGVTVGDGATIAAGAVVVDDVPARALVAGMPARVVRENVRGSDDVRLTAEAASSRSPD